MKYKSNEFNDLRDEGNVKSVHSQQLLNKNAEIAKHSAVADLRDSHNVRQVKCETRRMCQQD